MSPARTAIRSLIRAAAAISLALSSLFLPVSATPAVAATAGVGQHIAVPAYIYPTGTGATQWGQIASGAPTAGIAVANVYNGPSNQFDANWKTVIDKAHNAGVKVLGYVDTGYFGTTGQLTRLRDNSVSAWLAQIETDVNAWYQFYGASIDGIFFDQATRDCGPTTGSTTYSDQYQFVSDYAKRYHTGALTVLNPGIDVPQCYENSADILVTFESDYNAYMAFKPMAWESSYDPNKFWHLVYSVPDQTSMTAAMNQSKNNGAGYVYITDAAMPNPWNTLPAYWNAELAAAPVPSTGTPPTPAQPTASGIGGTSLTLSWASDPWNVVTGYDIYQGTIKIGEVTNFTPQATSYIVNSLNPATAYSFSVKGRSLAGDVSAASPVVNVTTAAANPTPPAAPSGLTSSLVKANSVQLSWTASTGSVAYYEVYQNGSRILTLPSSQLSARFDGLAPGTAYTYTVAARDASGALSPQSGSVAVTTPNPAVVISAPVSTLTATTATYSATYNLEFNSHIVFIDSDNSYSTGYQLFVNNVYVGADYMIQENTMYRYTGTGTSWSWAPVTTGTPAVNVNPQMTVNGDTYSWTIQAAWLGTHSTTEKVVFNGSGYSPTAYSTVLTVTQQ